MSGETQLLSTGATLLKPDGSTAVDPDCCGATPAPDVQVEGNGHIIALNSSSPKVTNWTEFGIGVTSRTFTVRNTGLATLTLSGLGLTSVSGPLEFAIGANFGSTSLAPGATTTFTIAFTGSGKHAAWVWFSNNVPAKDPYAFVVASCVDCRCPQQDVVIAGTDTSINGTYAFAAYADTGPSGVGPTWRWNQSGGAHSLWLHQGGFEGTWDLRITLGGATIYLWTNITAGCTDTTGLVWFNDPGLP